MSLYSKNGSIPKPETDGTEGWVEVPEAPTAGEGQEVVWWCPPGWVIRDTKPEQSLQTFNAYDVDGNVTSTEEKMADWSWCQSEEKWVAYPLPAIDLSTTETITILSADPTISLNVGTASDTISGGV